MERTFPEDCKHGGQAPTAALRLYVPVRSPSKAHTPVYAMDGTLAVGFSLFRQFKIQN
jgi:hypothetical protein